MARRNMRMEEYLELVYQWHRGRSIRQIRDSLQISRKTIRKYLLLFMASGLSREKPLPPQAELARILAWSGSASTTGRSRIGLGSLI